MIALTNDDDAAAATSSVGSTDYFINLSDESHLDDLSVRYWEPHSSSIDFCETNYALSGYVVEPHNAWSSIWGLSLFGVLGMLRGNPTGETMFAVTYAVLILIGIGSAALHGTLHWTFQSADELPMIYLVVCGMYCCMEIDAPGKNRPKHPNLSLYLVALCCVNTVIYFAYQKYYIVFLATFIAMLLGVVRLHVRIAWRMRKKRKEAAAAAACGSAKGYDEEGKGRSGRNAHLALQFYLWHYVAFALVAVPIWFLDQFRCAELLPLYNALPYPLRGATLHVVWHACSGLGAFLFVQFLAVCRADALGLECRLGRLIGILPVATLVRSGGTRTKKEL